MRFWNICHRVRTAVGGSGGWFLGVPILLLASSWTAAKEGGLGNRGWRLYRNEELSFQMKVPKKWTFVVSGPSVGFRRRRDGSGAAIGGMRSKQSGRTIDQAVRAEFLKGGRPVDWVQHLILVGGKRAFKVEFGAKPNHQTKMLLYYVEAPDGYYLIECLAPGKISSDSPPPFKDMIRSFEIL